MEQYNIASKVERATGTIKYHNPISLHKNICQYLVPSEDREPVLMS